MVTLELIAYLASIVYQAGFIEEKYAQSLTAVLDGNKINRLKQYTRAFLVIRSKLLELGDLKDSPRVKDLILQIAKSNLELIWKDEHWQTFSWFCLFILQNEYNDKSIEKDNQRRIHTVVHILSLSWLVKNKVRPENWNLKPLS